jgi:2-aminoadipate transaminase
MTVRGEQQLSDELAQLWAGHDLDGDMNAAARALSLGTATDWGMSWTEAPSVPPISLGGGMPDAREFPRDGLLRAFERVLRAEDDAEPLTYGGPLGSEALRAELASMYTRERGRLVGADAFMLTNGAAGSIDAVASALLDPGDVVITESPTFMGTIRTFRGHQAEVVGVPLDGDGLDLEALEAALAAAKRDRKRVKLIYTIANFQNPTGVEMSAERREGLLRLAAERGVYVLDDDAYGDIAFEAARPPALSALSGGHGVITAGSFSKSIATGLRVGWLHAQPALLERIARMRFDMGSSSLLHAMLHEFMASGEFEAHVARMLPLYAEKAATLERALVEHCEPYLTFARPRGGFFLWPRLQEGLTAEALQRAAFEEGVLFPLGVAFFPDRHDPEGEHIRLAYSNASLDELREAGARLGRACAIAAEA